MKMKQIIILAAIILVIVLSSCSPVDPPTSTKTYPPTGSYTYIPSSTATPIPTPSSSPIPQTPSPWPTVLLIITPNADQLARWQEYEYALGKALLSRELLRGAVLCEWEILGQSNSEIYVWVACIGTVPVGEQGIFPGAESPAVIFQETAGEIKNVEVPGSGTHYAYDIRKMFPVDVQERIFRKSIDFRRLSEHLETRLENPEPPLIVLSAMSTPNPVLGTLLPTQLTIVPTLNPTQVIQQEEIKSVIQEYFEIHYQALSTSPPEDFQEIGFGDLVSDGPDAKDFLVTEIAKLAVERKHYELNELLFVEYKYSLNYQSIIVDDSSGMADVSLYDIFEVIHERSVEANPIDPHVTMGGLPHEIVLLNEGDQWKIIFDIYWDSMWYTLRHPRDASTDEILRNIEEKMDQLEAMPSPTP